MINPKVSLRESAIDGKGLVAQEPIRTRELVWQLDPRDPTLRLSDVEKLTQEKQEEFYQFAFQCSKDKFVLCKGIDRFMNHSCDPNTWWKNNKTLVARRDIQPGEEVTYDYSTADILLEYQMRCTCGTEQCRKIVTNKDYLIPQWQKIYGNHLPDHVLESIKKEQKRLKKEKQKARG